MSNQNTNWDGSQNTNWDTSQNASWDAFQNAYANAGDQQDAQSASWPEYDSRMAPIFLPQVAFPSQYLPDYVPNPNSLSSHLIFPSAPAQSASGASSFGYGYQPPLQAPMGMQPGSQSRVPFPSEYLPDNRPSMASTYAPLPVPEYQASAPDPSWVPEYGYEAEPEARQRLPELAPKFKKHNGPPFVGNAPVPSPATCTLNDSSRESEEDGSEGTSKKHKKKRSHR